jgi:hypothetical protein
VKRSLCLGMIRRMKKLEVSAAHTSNLEASFM